MLILSDNKVSQCYLNSFSAPLLFSCSCAFHSTSSVEKPKVSVVSGAQQQEWYGREPGLEMLQLITRLTDILIAGFGFFFVVVGKSVEAVSRIEGFWLWRPFGASYELTCQLSVDSLSSSWQGTVLWTGCLSQKHRNRTGRPFPL